MGRTVTIAKCAVQVKLNVGVNSGASAAVSPCGKVKMS